MRRLTVNQPLILLTNDDGVRSPGLAALAAALAPMGDLLICAPATQQSGMGRAMPIYYDGRVVRTSIQYNGESYTAYGASASPAQAVLHAVLELAERPIDLCVSGINYGENVGMGITISGTVGAAMQAASFGIPSLAVSYEVDPYLHMSNDPSVDFSHAAYFASFFARRVLEGQSLPAVEVLKIDIPTDAEPATEWRLTRLERNFYYRPVPPQRESLVDEGKFGYERVPAAEFSPDSDAYAIREGVVSVTPLTLDMTAAVDLDELALRLAGEGHDTNEKVRAGDNGFR
jgi:5'-nucleotidase